MFHEFDGTVSFPLSSIPRSREMRRVINMCDVRERGGHASSSTFPHIDVSCITHLSRDVYFPFFSPSFCAEYQSMHDRGYHADYIIESVRRLCEI